MKKVNKHLSIIKARIGNQSTLKSIKNEENQMLSIFYNAFLQAKNKDFSRKDLENFNHCENYRKQLLDNHEAVDYKIFGSAKISTVSKVCKTAASKAVWAQFLYALTNQFNEPKVLEMGTNLGISGSYILNALKEKSNSIFTTMEGHPQLLEIATNNFNSITQNVEINPILGLYNDTFPELIKTNYIKFNLLFIDGNHKKKPTLNYFKELKENHIENEAIFIFDDINWSKGMKEAWEIIKQDKEIAYSIDLYKLGVIIIDKNKKPNSKHYTLHYAY